MIKALRDLARAGRAETEKLAIDEAGKPKIVWGHTLADEELPLDAAALISEEETVINPDVEPSVEDALVAVAAADEEPGVHDVGRTEEVLQKESATSLDSELSPVEQETSKDADLIKAVDKPWR